MIIGKGYTDRGGRAYNEDVGLLGKKGNVCYAVMADGLGGHGNGDKAAETAVITIKKCFEELPEDMEITKEDMIRWFDLANRNVMSMQTQECMMKTTLAFLCIDEKEGLARLAHLGDSRIYHFEDGKCAFCTFDHSVSRMAVLAGEIEMKDIRFHADRNKLLKAIGKSEDVTAEIDEISLKKGVPHAFLLCTDGFWEYVTEEEMEQELAVADSPEEWLELMREYIKKRAKGNNDNNSAIAIRME